MTENQAANCKVQIAPPPLPAYSGHPKNSTLVTGRTLLLHPEAQLIIQRLEKPRAVVQRLFFPGNLQKEAFPDKRMSASLLFICQAQYYLSWAHSHLTFVFIFSCFHFPFLLEPLSQLLFSLYFHFWYVLETRGATQIGHLWSTEKKWQPNASHTQRREWTLGSSKQQMDLDACPMLHTPSWAIPFQISRLHRKVWGNWFASSPQMRLPCLNFLSDHDSFLPQAPPQTCPCSCSGSKR